MTFLINFNHIKISPSYLLILLFLLITSCYRDEGCNNTFHCDIYLDNLEILLENPLEIDLSRVHAVQSVRDMIYIADYSRGYVSVYNTFENTFYKIGEKGAGPFEFSSTRFVIVDDTLYIYDPGQAKLASFDILQQVFISEYSIGNDFTLGRNLLDVNNGKYFIQTIRRAEPERIESQILRLDIKDHSLDTLLTYTDNNMIWYRDNGFDFGAVIGNLGNVLPVMFNGILYIFENTRFAYHESDNPEIRTDVNFSYNPDYDWYLSRYTYSIQNTGLNPESTLEYFKKAIDSHRKEYSALYEEVIPGDDLFIFKLFATGQNAYLLYDRTDNSNTILCSKPQYRIIYSDNNNLYWIQNKDFSHYSLIKSQLARPPLSNQNKP